MPDWDSAALSALVPDGQTAGAPVVRVAKLQSGTPGSQHLTPAAPAAL